MPENNTKSGQTEGEFKIQPVPEPNQQQGGNPASMAHKAHPGPAIPQSMPAEEGSKEERQAKAKELNK